MKNNPASSFIESAPGEIPGAMHDSDSQQPRAVVITCGALAREVVALLKMNDWQHIKPVCVAADLHNHPQKIPGAVKELIDKARQNNQQIFVAYGDCGTAGKLDVLLQQEGIERIPGAHCYEFFSGHQQFENFQQQEIGTFYLTDFLVRHFERLVIHGLGLDRKPELLPMYFGNYRKLLYIAQTQNEELQVLAQQAADKLGLEYAYHYAGYAELGSALHKFNQSVVVDFQ